MLTFTRASSAYNPVTGNTDAVDTRRRRDITVAGQTVSADLIETSATNLCLQSEDLNTTWTKEQISVSVNTQTNKNIVLQEIVEDTSVSIQHGVTQVVTVTPSMVNTWSVYVKQGTGTARNVHIAVARDGAYSAARATVSFDMVNGTWLSGAADEAVGGMTVDSKGFEDLGSGFYRIWLVTTNDATTTLARIRCDMLAGTDRVYTGNGVSSIYCGGFQMEQGEHPTSYVKTVASTVTRAEDKLTWAHSGIPQTGTWIAAQIYNRSLTGRSHVESGVFFLSYNWNSTTLVSQVLANRFASNGTTTNQAVLTISDNPANDITAWGTKALFGMRWDATAQTNQCFHHRGTLELGSLLSSATVPFASGTTLQLGAQQGYIAARPRRHIDTYIAMFLWERILVDDEIKAFYNSITL